MFFFFKGSGFIGFEGVVLHLRLAGLRHKLIYASESNKILRDRIAHLYSPEIISDDAERPISR